MRRTCFEAVIFCVVILGILVMPHISHAQKEVIGNQPPGVCEHFASLANEGKLNGILVKSEPQGSTRVPVPEELSGVIYKQFIDINNDGVPERVFMIAERSAGETYFLAYDWDLDNDIQFTD